MTTKLDMNKINTFIKESYESGKTRGSIEGFISFTYEVNDSEAKKMVQNVLGKQDSQSATWEETIRYIRANYGKLDKKELINGMCKVKGGTYNSMQHAYNYIKFAMEYARQEVEASKKEAK